MGVNLRSNQPFRYCALAYRAPEAELPAPPTDDRLIMLLFLSSDGQLSISFDPGWPTYVHPGDRQYISEMLTDFKVRTQTRPEDLFMQVSSISNGPLVTEDVGTEQEYSQRLADCRKQFVPIESWI